MFMHETMKKSQGQSRLLLFAPFNQLQQLGSIPRLGKGSASSQSARQGQLCQVQRYGPTLTNIRGSIRLHLQPLQQAVLLTETAKTVYVHSRGLLHISCTPS